MLFRSLVVRYHRIEEADKVHFSHGAEELTLRGEREADWWQSSYLWSSQAQQAAATSTAAVGRRLARRPPIGAPTGGLRALCAEPATTEVPSAITCGLSLYLRSTLLLLSQQLAVSIRV